jgi:hypothetical protein
MLPTADRTVPMGRSGVTVRSRLCYVLKTRGKGFIGIGANGFCLKQTTGDSGNGARLGSFEEMTAGVGPVLSYAAQFGKTSIAAELKWLPQIDAQKTLKGDYIWFKVGVQF